MKKILIIFIMMAFIVPTVFADSYVASRQELWFSDSSYYKTSHHIKIGKNFKNDAPYFKVSSSKMAKFSIDNC